MEFQTLVELIVKEYGKDPVIIAQIMNQERSKKVKSNETYVTEDKVLIIISNDPDNAYEGFSLVIMFTNGYGCSVIWRYGSYGYSDDKLELAVLKHENHEKSELCYDSPTDICQGDVEGYLSAKEAFEMIQEIERIEEN